MVSIAAGASLYSAMRSGLRRYSRGGSFRTAKAAGRFLPKGLRAPGVAMGGVVDVGVGAVGMAGRGALKALGFAGKHPWASTATGLAAFGSIGAGRGLNQANRSISPVIPQARPLQSLSGPGFTTWSRPPSRVGSLGATGSLPLAMHRRRHG